MSEFIGLIFFIMVLLVPVFIAIFTLLTISSVENFINKLVDAIGGYNKKIVKSKRNYYTYKRAALILTCEINEFNIVIEYEYYDEGDFIIKLEKKSNKKFDFYFSTEKSKNTIYSGAYKDILFDIFEFDNIKKAVARLSNNKIRDIINYLLNNRINIIIDNGTMKFRHHFISNTLINKNKLKIFKEAIVKSLIFINYILTDKTDDELIILNIKNEKDQDIRIINIQQLIENKIDLNSSLIKDLQNDNDKIISAIASIIINKNTDKNLEILLNSNKKRAIFFALEYINYHYNKVNADKLLIDSLFKYDDTDIIIKIFEILSFYYSGNNYLNKKIIDFINQKKSIIEKMKILKLALIQFVSNTKIKESISWLVEKLYEKDEEIIIESINALGSIGDIKAVESLLPFMKGILFPSDIKYAARNAIQQIQKNIPKDQQGDLTLTEIEKSGELSLNSDDNTGKLTIEKE